MSKQIAARIEKIQNTFGKMSIRDQIRQVEGGPDTPIHKAAYEGEIDTLKVRVTVKCLYFQIYSKI